jgi:2Fe-2S ferredoxin
VNAPSRVVRFTPLGLAATARTDESLLDVARRIGAPLGNSCGGVGVCARCRVRIVSGAENVSAPTSVETRFARDFTPGERMACQAVVMGDVEITTTYW